MANSKKELLEWLALKPRTAGWGAVVAYDRSKCNNLLLQDYINKFTTNSYLEPINEPVAVGDANWQHLSDWVTDVPRLSFENSSKAAGGEATMKMAVIGGTQVNIDNTLGHKRAIAVHSIDALDHPELIAENVVLSKTSGTVDKDTGQVVLDLGAADTAKGPWELTFANTRHERLIGGAFFKQYFKGADKEKRLYHLGRIAFTDQQYLKPASFILRTITATGAESKTAKNFGDGAVELFVCMEGDQEGDVPPLDDWKSLIPDDRAGQYDSAILLSNKLFMEKIIYEGVRRAAYPLPAGSDFLESQFDSAGFVTLVAKPGLSYIRSPGGLYVGDNYTFLHRGPYGGSNVDLLVASTEPLKVKVYRQASGNVVSLEWASHGKDVNEYQYVVSNTGIGEPVPQKVILFWRIMEYIELSVDVATGAIAFERSSAAYADAGLENKGITDFRVLRDFNAIYNTIKGSITFGIRAELHDVFHSLKYIDLFVLNSILFSGRESVKLKDVSIPGDVAIFGQIKGLVTVTPQEHLMGHGSTHTFKVPEDFTGTVEWSVTAIPGSSGGVGTINKETGHYSAPALADISGTFTRVRITATDPLSKASSSALVTVVVRDITINPVVQICSASTIDAAITRTLSANTLGEGILEWKVKRGTGTIPTRAGSDGKNTYTAGLKDPAVEGTFLIDEIEVMNLATRKTQTSYVVVTHYQAELTITIDMDNSSFPEGKAKLVARDGRDRPVAAVWDVAEGNGCIDSDGLYTGDPDGQQRFALITARLGGGADTKDGWIILPWPLFELPNKPEPIDDLSFD